MPGGKQVPDGGLQATVTPEQLSEAVAVKLTVAHGVGVQTFCGVTAMMLAGQETDGAWVSLTVTVNMHEEPLVVETVTVVTPFGKDEPDGGLTDTTPQLPEIGGT